MWCRSVSPWTLLSFTTWGTTPCSWRSSAITNSTLYTRPAQNWKTSKLFTVTGTIPNFPFLFPFSILTFCSYSHFSSVFIPIHSSILQLSTLLPFFLLTPSFISIPISGSPGLWLGSSSVLPLPFLPLRAPLLPYALPKPLSLTPQGMLLCT